MPDDEASQSALAPEPSKSFLSRLPSRPNKDLIGYIGEGREGAGSAARPSEKRCAPTA